MNKFEESLYKIRQALQLQDMAGNLHYDAYSKIDEQITEALKLCGKTPSNSKYNYSVESFKENFTLVDNHFEIAQMKENFEKIKETQGEEYALEYKEGLEQHMKEREEETPSTFGNLFLEINFLFFTTIRWR